MAGSARRITSAVVGAMFTLGIPVWAAAQTRTTPVGTVAPLASGAIGGVVYDDQGKAVEGAVVTAIGATTTVAVTDDHGRFELQQLTPGPYVVRAHRSGFTTPRPELLDVRPSGRASFVLALKPVPTSRPLLAAGFGLGAGAVQPGDPPPQGAPDASTPESGEGAEGEDEVAWRLRHSRRGVLKTVSLPAGFFDDEERSLGGWAAIELFDRAVATPARAASSFFTDTPFSGQVNLLTSGSFHTPQQLFSNSQNSRGIAYVKVGAPVGDHADWTMRGALTQADLSSWIVAGSYTTRAPARHRYDIGMSYSTQRYDGGNPFALRDVTDGSRNAGMVYGFDSFAISRNLTVTYGGRYARYDYLQHRRLVSPKVEVTLTPADHVRVTAIASRRAQAPGAEEFLPPGDDAGIWLPPQRTFSSLDPDQPLRAERATHTAIAIERDVATSTIGFRVFREHVDDQLVTIFGARLADQLVGQVGHYFVDNAGQVDAAGCSVSFASTIARRVHGSVAYTVADARMTPTRELDYLMLLAPAVANARRERIHDVATTLQADVPETATRVVVLYRVSNGFAQPRDESRPDAPQLGSRFDVQVRQSLPFLNFTNARWEMLVAVRDFFHETSADQAVYDELLVVRPPKRIVGGVTLHF